MSMRRFPTKNRPGSRPRMTYCQRIAYYPARPLKRLSQQLIVNPSAKRIMMSEFGPGDETVVEHNADAFAFEKR